MEIAMFHKLVPKEISMNILRVSIDVSKHVFALFCCCHISSFGSSGSTSWLLRVQFACTEVDA
jgi:hypothetical protein